MPLTAKHESTIIALRRTACAAAALALVLLLLFVNSGAHPPSVRAAAQPAPTLADPDRACAGCHAAIYQTYERTNMARGSGLATEALKPGSFASQSSGATYRVQSRNGTATLTSRREDERAPLDDTETLAYFIGSGLHARTYLFARNLPDSDDLLWYEAPINWYTRRAGYAMTPAFEHAQTAPLALPTDPNCLHCHTTGVADTIDNSTNRFHGAPFRQGGVGCSACHGDTSAHLASGGKTPVLHLATLTPKKQDSVCLQCHLEGDAVVQRTGRSLARFQPGEDLDDTAIYFVNASSSKTQARASSQYEALLRSACRRGAGERLTCVTCHDPHAEPAPEQRVAFYRGKCLQCHTESASFHPAAHHPEQPDCAQCHMPSRATSDIAHEQNVDHNIQARPASGAAPTLALRDAFHFASAVDLVPVGDAKPTDRETGLAYAQFAEKGDRESHSRALALLTGVEVSGHADAVVHQQLGYLLQLAGQSEAAQKEYVAALAARPHDATSESNLAVLDAQNGNVAEAKRLLSDVAATAPDRTAALLNLAMLQCRTNDPGAAKKTLQRALMYQPDSFEARLFLENGDYGGMHCKVF
ncbi:tetratricopeptide repeat protein [Terriglobus aquaticus]|uniref:Tetratricopeptide repeat protein n=1 Tax=Terriglobus aquaticus TaxID=940139 RepID=A0ABW9KGK8_9BACT|nr:tetratricopeptide repeat protein [Terriglobus aquaticus]